MTALSFTYLRRRVVRHDPSPVEIALLAHLLLDETRLDRYTRPRLSPAARALRDIITTFPASTRATGLTSAVRYLHASPDPAQLALAAGVDALTVQELAALLSFECIAAALGAHRKAARRRDVPLALSPALARELHSA